MPMVWSFEISDEQEQFIKEEMKRHGFKSKPAFFRSLISNEMNAMQGALRPIIINVGGSPRALGSYSMSRHDKIGIPQRDKKCPPRNDVLTVTDELKERLKELSPDVEILSGKGKLPNEPDLA